MVDKRSDHSSTTTKSLRDLNRNSADPASVAIGHFVGRGRELARLHAAWATACSGQGNLVFLTGEPGIGKTALLQSFAAEIQQQDGLVL